MFTLADYIILGITAVCAVVFTATWNSFNEPENRTRLIVIIVEVILFVALIGGCAAYRSGTESGKRGLKSWQSETTGGIDRTVTVYDIQGEEIARYSGRFDIEESSQEGVVKIKFDVNGKRHIIYAQTGTVLIDEN